jgi:hypothetical protein
VFEKMKEFVNAPIKDGIRGTASVVGASQAPVGATSSNCSMRLTVQIPDHAPYNVEHQCIVKVSKWPWPGTTLPVSVDPKKLDHIRIEWGEVKTSKEQLDAQYPVYGSPAATDGSVTTPGAGGEPVIPDMSHIAGAQDAIKSVLAQNGMGAGGVVDLRDRPEVRDQVFAALDAKGVDTTALRARVKAREAAAAGGAPAAGAIPGASPAAPSEDDELARLEKLGKLRDSGVLTADEFETQKRKILGGI